MTIDPRTQFRTFLVSLALTAGVGAVLPIGSGAQSQELHWATQAGGPGEDAGLGIATTARGQSYVTGHFAGTATFGAGEPNQTILTTTGGPGIFVAKYDRDGGLLWATQADASQAFGIATTARGDSYVTGNFSGTATFGAGEPNQTILTTTGTDLFVAKYDRDGGLLWATQAGGSQTAAQALDIATTARGESYVIGEFFGTATFGAGEPNETILTGFGDLFVAKYDRDGGLLWATQASQVGGTHTTQARSIATTARGDSYVTGGFSGTATFGAGEPNQTILTTTGNSDLFVAKYDRDGGLLWATQAGGSGLSNEALGQAIAITARGDSYVTGNFIGTVTFGAGEPNETILAGDIHTVVAKYDRDGGLLWAIQTGGDEGNGIATTARGDSYVIGHFRDTQTFGAGEPNQTILTATGEDDTFVAKFDRDGELLWVTQAGGPDNVQGSGIATTARGDSYVTGQFQGTATFGAGEPNETILTATGPGNIFVAKYR